jgi:4'-phosphopantetheinyl transferase
MPFWDSFDVIPCRLSIRRGDAELLAMLVIAVEKAKAPLDQVAAELLGPTEAAYYSSLRFERRQRSYLLGRYAAKLALSEVLAEPNFRSIEIVRGVFDQPIVYNAHNARWSATISHSDCMAAGLAYPTGHPMGIDVERIDQSRYETILSELSSQEIDWVENGTIARHEVAIALWTAKEALSKALTTGLMSPFKMYDLTEFRRLDSGAWKVLFQNFAQYKAVVWIGSSYVLSIVLPRRSMMYEYGDLRGAL